MSDRPMTNDQLIDARDWIKDCTWSDLAADEVDLLTDAQVIQGIEQHYCGGIEAFLLAIKNR